MGNVRNRLGQFTGAQRWKIKITKQLKDIAEEAEVRIKPIVRDKAEQVLRESIIESYQPATKKGKSVQDYNKTHKHQKSNTYHHTGLLASSIYANIEGDIITTNVRDRLYPDGTSTTKVYDILKFGTKKESDKKRTLCR